MTLTLSPEQIVAEARKHIGTPWHHAGRLPGVGLDCSGLLLAVMWGLGLDVPDETDYSRGDEYERMAARLGACCRLLSDDEPAQSGDILLFRARQMTNHCGFYVGDGTLDGALIHAYNSPSVGCVTEHRLDESWQKRVSARYRLHAVEGNH